MKKLASVSEVTQTLRNNDFRIKKHFGQNFITDSNIIDEIIRSSGVSKNDVVIEVGPGMGSLTQKLVESTKHVIAVEIDRDLVPILSKNFADVPNFTLIQGDILDMDVDQMVQNICPDAINFYVISNLPYYITTPILMKFLETSQHVKKMIYMMQLEVAERISSKPNTKDYNALSIAIQYRANTKILFRVPRTVFIPQPNVDSAVVSIELKQVIPQRPMNEAFFFRFIHIAFAQRRKTLFNNLRFGLSNISEEEIKDALVKANIVPEARAESLDIEKFIILSDLIDKSNI